MNLRRGWANKKESDCLKIIKNLLNIYSNKIDRFEAGTDVQIELNMNEMHFFTK